MCSACNIPACMSYILSENGYDSEAITVTIQKMSKQTTNEKRKNKQTIKQTKKNLLGDILDRKEVLN